MYNLLTRSFQAIARPAAYALDWQEPDLLIGEGRFKKLPDDLITQDIARLLIITDEGIQSSGLLDHFSGLLDHFIDGLEEKI